MRYTYRNTAGEERTIEAPMSNPPPERVWMDGQGNWFPSLAKCPLADPATEGTGYEVQMFTRVYHEPKAHVRWQPGPGLRRDCRFKPGAV